jgi:hypothetical protein
MPKELSGWVPTHLNCRKDAHAAPVLWHASPLRVVFQMRRICKYDHCSTNGYLPSANGFPLPV